MRLNDLPPSGNCSASLWGPGSSEIVSRCSSNDKAYHGYPFHNRLLRLHPFGYSPFNHPYRYGKSSKTAAQQCEYYEVDNNIFVYGGNITSTATYPCSVNSTETGTHGGDFTDFRFDSAANLGEILAQTNDSDMRTITGTLRPFQWRKLSRSGEIP